ncbi:MAG: TolC family protein [Acidobacteria bacterium]|nr:TolC family protein [Acidobacteriota bacterium]
MGLKTRMLSTCIIICICLGGLALTQEPEEPAGLRAPYVPDLFYHQFITPESPLLPRPDVGALAEKATAGKIRLTIEDVVQLAVRNHLGIHLERYSVLDSRQSFFQAESIFEPMWSQHVSGGRDTRPSPSIFTGVGSTVSKDISYSTQISKYFSTGTSLQADISLRRFETNNQFYLVNPSLETSWTLSLTQNLLKGFGRDVNRAPLLVARNNLRLSEAEFRLKLEQILLEATQLYWDILYLELDLKVREEFLELAKKTRDDIAHHVDVGTQPELNLFKARADVANRLSLYIQAETDLKNAKQRLLTYLSPEAGVAREPDFSLQLEELDPRTREKPLDWEESLRTALEVRPEIAASRSGIAIREIDVRVARNSLLPSLSVTAGYSQYGLKGVVSELGDLPFEIPPGTRELLEDAFAGGIWASLSNSFSGQYNGFFLQLDLSIPIGNRDARAQAQRAAIQLEKSRLALDDVRQQITQELRTVYNLLARDRAVMESATQARIEAEKNLDGEQARYDAGMVVIRDLLEAQRDLSQAVSLENLARIYYRKDLLAYYKAAGMLLEKLNIRTESALKGES